MENVYQYWLSVLADTRAHIGYLANMKIVCTVGQKFLKCADEIRTNLYFKIKLIFQIRFFTIYFIVLKEILFLYSHY